MSAADLWEDVGIDPTACPVCGSDSCEDQDHLPPPEPSDDYTTQRDDAEGREARIAQEMERGRTKREARRRLDAEERDPFTPEILTLHQFMTELNPGVQWRIKGWQPVGSRVILAAPYKAGKTTLSGSLVRSLADGDEWLGRYEVQPVEGAIAIIDTEMSRVQLRRWLCDQRIRRADRVLVLPLRGRAAALDLPDQARRAQWCQLLRQGDVRYLIIDCLRPVFDALGLDESREAGRWLVGLDSLLREADIPEALVVHHMGHTGERSRGDSRLRDWPDAEWRLVRQDDDSSPRYLAAYGRDVDIPESQLAYDATTRRLTLVGGSRRNIRLTRALDAIVEVIQAADEPRTGRQIESALADSDHRRDTVRTALRDGVREGRLKVEPGPRNSRLYRLPSMPPAGKPESTP